MPSDGPTALYRLDIEIDLGGPAPETYNRAAPEIATARDGAVRAARAALEAAGLVIVRVGHGARRTDGAAERSVEPTVVVGCSRDHIRSYMAREGLAQRHVIAVPADEPPRALHGISPLARDVVLLDGWWRGPHDEDVLRTLRHVLARHGQRFEDCRRAA